MGGRGKPAGGSALQSRNHSRSGPFPGRAAARRCGKLAGQRGAPGAARGVGPGRSRGADLGKPACALASWLPGGARFALDAGAVSRKGGIIERWAASGKDSTLGRAAPTALWRRKDYETRVRMSEMLIQQYLNELSDL